MTRVRTVEPVIAIVAVMAFFVVGTGAVLVAFALTHV